MKLRTIILALLVGLLAGSCVRRPGYVLSTNKMARVMADIHTAEAFVDMSPRDFGTDSARMLLKQSVLASHKVTMEEFDTSMVWYGHHMDKYLQVLDKEIALLENREKAEGARAREASLSISGDSVDVWAGSRYVSLNKRYPSMAVPFTVTVDENSEPGDQYTWRIKLVDGASTNINWSMVANYADSTIEYLFSTTTQTGWNEMSFVTDSTKQLETLRGQFMPVLEDENGTLSIDSIQLVRKRLDPEKYHTRYRQRSWREYR